MVYTDTYALKKGSEIIGFAELIIEPFDIMVAKFTVIKEDMLPKELIELISNTKCREDALYHWMHSRVPDPPCKGYEFDQYIVKELGLSPKVMVNGRLSGMENILALRNHYKGKDDFHLVPKDIVTICFFNLLGWDKILVSQPTMSEDIA